MWPFSRKPEPTNAPDPASATPHVHFDWKSVPSIQRTAGEHPLTVPTESFAANLTTHDDPRAVAKPLGHELSLAAPPGIVLGIARTQTRGDGPDLVPGPRAGRRSLQRVIDESVASEPQAAPFAPVDADESAAPPTPLHRLPASTEPLPSLQLMRVSPETEPMPLEPEIVTPSEEPQPAGAESSQQAEETTALPSYPRLTLGQARRLGLGAPMKHVPETATSVQRISEVPAGSPESPPHPISAESTPRRISAIQEESTPKFEPFILDYLVNKKPEIRAPAPISRPQRIPVSVSRSIAAEPPEAASTEPASERATPTETVEESTPDATAAPSEPPTAVQREAEAEVEDVPVQPTPMSTNATSIEPIAGPPPLAAATDPKRTLLADAPKGEAGEGEGEAMPPLPLALDASVAVTPELSAALPVSSMAPLVTDSPQLVTRASSPIATSVQRSTDSTAPTVQRSTELASLSVQRAAEPAPAAGRTMSHAGIRRVLGSAAGVPDLELLSQPESSPSARAEDVAIASTSPMTSPSFPSSLPLARPSQPFFAAAPPVQRSASVQTSTEPEGWSSVQTSTAVLEPESEVPSVSMQRVPAQEWTVSAAAEPQAAGPSLVAAGEAGPSTAGADDEGHIEDLAAKLYDRIRIRLRDELLVDRERAGFLTDLR